MIREFELDESHAAYRDEVGDFCHSEIEPHVEEYESDGEFPADLVRRVAENGLVGIPYPAEYGGAGLDFRSFAIASEELARAWKLIAGAVNVVSSLVGYPVYTYGEEWQREEWLEKACTGEWIAALGMTEPEAGSDAGSIRTSAERDSDEWVIDGHKVWMTNGSVADLMILVVRTDDGLSLVGVPEPWDRDGVELVRDIPCMEGEASVESEVTFDGVRVPAENLVGTSGKGLRYVLEGLDIGRIGTGAQGVGVAQAALDASRSFADEREQFGKPIREFQGVGFKLAEMAIEVEAARLLTLSAADKRDRGQRVTQAAAMAKAYATDVAMDAATEAVQIHGSRGYSTDYPVERYMRVAKGMQIYEGTNEINRQVITNRMYES
ncbi:acyl-CoA dehydrogenase family protein [Natronococcus wangiae]|uniref:acyl-CoA dehydrogenase family protein n=1 Tax=Natronococcus wangiae TaxID=3068275 RepID=UPI0027402D51|nr:acyl-CoA dehydrogenase family protein [Natronococcus sp. AD5]